MPSVYAEAQRFIRALEQLHAPALAAYEAELARILPMLEAQAVAAAERIAAMQASGATLTELQLFSRERARIIAVQVQAAVTRLSGGLVAPLDGAVGAALMQGVDAASALIGAQLPDGFPLAFARPNFGALQAALGAQQGAPLADLLGQLGPDAGRLVRDKLNAGLVAGKNPRVVARSLRQVADLSASRAETIAVDQTLKAFKVASQQAYEASGVVQEYERRCARQVRTCAACWALDGTRYPSSELMPQHVRDRCAMIPVVDIPGVARRQPERGADIFARQSPEFQRAVLGQKGADLYQQGVPLSRFARVEHDPDWGATVRVARLSEVA